jgi:hypothetical protein
MDRSELDEAEAAFARAAAIDLFEVPNYEVLIRVAEVDCLQGRIAGGRALLGDFACMLDVDEGRAHCFEPGATGQAEKPNPKVTPRCFSSMCGEIYLPYYEHPAPETLAKIKRLRGEVERVNGVCRAAGDAQQSR